MYTHRIETRILILLASVMPLESMAYSAGGSAVAVAGRFGDPNNPILSTPTVRALDVGTFSSGEITSRTGSKAIATFSTSVNPMPSITLFAEGIDTVGTNKAGGSATGGVSYTFVVSGGPVGTPVSLGFEGITYSNHEFSGTIEQNAISSGTRLTIHSPGVERSLKDLGNSGSQPLVEKPDLSGFVRIGWGIYSPGGAKLEYFDFYRFSMTAFLGTPIFVGLEGVANGGVGPLSQPGVEATGSVTVGLDPYFYIDPTVAAAHPEYTIQMEAGVGNAAPVPIPSLLGLYTMSVAGLLGWLRKWSKVDKARPAVA